MSETADTIAAKIADAYYPPLPEVVERHLSLERAKAQQHLIDVATPILAPLVQRAESAERERPKWISTAEQVPNAGQTVLICEPPLCEGMAPRIDTATWVCGFWQNKNWHRNVRREKVPWWMPLPAAPSAGAEVE